MYFVTDCLHVSSHLMSTLKFSQRENKGRIYPQCNIRPVAHDVQNWAQPHFDCRCTVKTENVIMPCTMGTADGDETTHENDARSSMLLRIVYCF